MDGNYPEIVKVAIEAIGLWRTAEYAFGKVRMLADQAGPPLERLLRSQNVHYSPKYSDLRSPADIEHLVRALREDRAHSNGAQPRKIATPLFVSIKGYFAPKTLATLFILDNQQRVRTLDDLQWRDPLQRWLAHGFAAWGASLDLNSKSAAATEPCHGQIGFEDEASSLPVCILPPYAGAARALFSDAGWVKGTERAAAGRRSRSECKRLTGAAAVKVHLRGVLFHVSDFRTPRGLRRATHNDIKRESEIGEEFSIFVGLRDLQIKARYQYGITQAFDQGTDVYSAYLWQLMGPDGYAAADLPIAASYFVWEHANLLCPHSIEYGLDCLEKKSALLVSRHKRAYATENLVAFAKSAEFVRGRCVKDTHDLVREILKQHNL